MKDLDLFMKWEYVSELDINLYISGSEFINNQPVTADDMKVLISDWWTKCRNLYCIIDLKDMSILGLDILGVICLVQDLEDFNKDNTMLKSIKFINCNFLIKWIYRGVSIGIPSSVREIISFA